MKHQTMNLNEENRLKKQGYRYIIGIDEAGRGPLAGPVVAGAVYYRGKNIIEGVKDSKKISEKKRASLYFKIVNHPCVMWGVGIVSSTEIDQINILEATKKAMINAVKDLEKRNNIEADYLILDGKMSLSIPITQISIIKGDDKIFSCAAGSIIAKFVRDQLMMKMDKKYPEYNFKKHKGYGTKEHLLNIEKYGACPIHRKSFKPIRI